MIRLILCIRYSAWETLTVDNAVNDLEALKKQVRIYLANDFDFVALRGSAFLLAKSLDTNTGITELLKSLFQKVALLSRELSPRRIGIGVACGEYADVLWGQRMLFGPVVSRAEELSRLAVPQGVVISAAEGMPDLTVELAQVITLRTVYWHDKLTEKAYCSSDVVQSKPARYFYQHQNDERRYFINFGRRCHRKCIYCMTRNVPMDCESFDADLFRRELAGVVASGRGDDYLFSLGYLNEPLEKGHFENALCIVRALLARTTGVVQIATKCSPKRIRDFLNCLTIDERRRVTIMYSVSTLKYADHIEPQREEFSVTEREELIGLKNEGYAVMPYVKPFLPGLTDDDEELEEFLLKFSKIVVGYPYLSREVSHQIARICIAENKKALKYYSHARLDELRSSLPLEAPCVANVEYHSADFQKELEVFVQRLESKKKEVFISSPCAVADRYSTTCYTSVGRGDKPFHQQLCREQCSNTGCIYRKRIAHDRTDLIAFVKGELRQRRHLCRDRSHAYDHFIRVHELAQHILAEHAKMLEGKGIKLEDVFTDQDKLVLELSCLVHDLGDPKLSTSPFQQDEEDLRSVAAESFLQTVKRTFGMPNEVVISQVKLVVAKCSFSDYVKDHDIRENIHGTSHLQLRGVDLSGRILFDADLMDAMGAVGVARCFAFPKNKGILDPREPFRSLDELKSVPGYRCAITHFFEKLLRLRTLLMPASLQVMGDRHEKLMSYLVSFLREASVGLDQNERDDLRRNIEAYMGSNGLASSEDWQMLVHAVGAVSPSARGEA
jgi:HD superfamily phosphodiesterase/DNA repair photolyase